MRDHAYDRLLDGGACHRARIRADPLAHPDTLARWPRTALKPYRSNTIAVIRHRQTHKHDAPTHTLWYDISAQALFDEAFRPIIADIENGLIEVVARLLKRVKLDQANALTVY